MSTPVCCIEESFILFKLFSDLLNLLIYDGLGWFPLDTKAQLLHFFLLNLFKTTTTIATMIYLVSLIRASFTPERARLFLHNRPLWQGYLLGALLGIITPFCSCSAVPIFLAFTGVGIPLGITIAFLVSAPLVTEGGVVLMAQSMGISITLFSIGVALLLGIIAGALFDFFTAKGSHFLKKPITTLPSISRAQENINVPFRQRHYFASQELQTILTSIAPWLIGSILLATLLHQFLPAEVTMTFLAKDAWWSVPLAVIIGIPLYGTAGTIIPITSVLYSQGAAIGTLLAFILSTNGASLPAFILLKPVFTTKGIAFLFCYFLLAFTLVGLIVNGIAFL